MCLTTRDHTMQRGACEAVSLGRPVITSDWPLLRSAFPLGAAFADNTADGIVAAIRQVREDHERFRAEAERLRNDRVRDWATQRAVLATLLERRMARQAAA
jgi:hypothetical protein